MKAQNILITTSYAKNQSVAPLLNLKKWKKKNKKILALVKGNLKFKYFAGKLNWDSFKENFRFKWTMIRHFLRLWLLKQPNRLVFYSLTHSPPHLPLLFGCSFICFILAKKKFHTHSISFFRLFFFFKNFFYVFYLIFI